MIDELPEFNSAINLLRRYSKLSGGRLDQTQVEILGEAIHRLKDIKFLAIRIHGVCRKMSESGIGQNPPTMPFGLDIQQIIKNALDADPELAKKEPLLKKVAYGEPSVTYGDYAAILTTGGWGSLEPDEIRALRLDVEQFYYVAHRFSTCLARLPGLGNFKCKVIAVVRNQLLEHPENKSSGIVHSTFGYRDKVGPLVKMGRRTGQKDIHLDAGFIPNCRELLEKAAATLDQGLGYLIETDPLVNWRVLFRFMPLNNGTIVAASRRAEDKSSIPEECGD